MDNVIVTGASRGLGLAIAVRLAAIGFRVIAVSRRETEALRIAMNTAEADSVGAIVFRPCDLADGIAIPALARDVKREFGPIYGLVNNAGLGTSGLLATMPDPDIEALIRLNTLAPILLAKYVVRGMMVEKRGRVINMSSIIASTGFGALAAYGATKASMIGFTKSLAREVGRLGITVNAIAPGFIDTEMTHDLGAEGRERVVSRAALKRLADPEDVAAAVAFLMGEGGRNITGTVLTVDAGSTA
jgi:3-oxoacyl-[acyl-carrier protein] reductase